MRNGVLIIVYDTNGVHVEPAFLSFPAGVIAVRTLGVAATK